MNEFDDLTSRLKALGDNPVPPPVATQHLTAMAELAAPRRFSQKLRVAAAFGVGIFVGGTGLGYAAAEGQLPDTAQNGIAVAMAKVGVELPRGSEKSENGEENGGKKSPLTVLDAACSESRGEFVSRNVKLNRDQNTKGGANEIAQAAKENCPQPTGDDGDEQGPAGAEEDADKPAKNEDKGKPADAGKPADVPAGGAEVENEGDDLDAEGDEDGAGSQGGAEGAPGGGRPEDPGNAPVETPVP